MLVEYEPRDICIGVITFGNLVWHRLHPLRLSQHQQKYFWILRSGMLLRAINVIAVPAGAGQPDWKISKETAG